MLQVDPGLRHRRLHHLCGGGVDDGVEHVEIDLQPVDAGLVEKLAGALAKSAWGGMIVSGRWPIRPGAMMPVAGSATSKKAACTIEGMSMACMIAMRTRSSSNFGFCTLSPIQW
jgi:hypothetical protein